MRHCVSPVVDFKLDEMTVLPVTAYEVPEPRSAPIMTERVARRVTRELTPAEKDRLEELRKKVADELPEMVARDQLRHEVRGEATISGELRRAIHASQQSLSRIAAQVGISPVFLDEFLTGERTLRSDVMDRLAGALGYDLTPSIKQ